MKKTKSKTEILYEEVVLLQYKNQEAEETIKGLEYLKGHLLDKINTLEKKLNSLLEVLRLIDLPKGSLYLNKPNYNDLLPNIYKYKEDIALDINIIKEFV